MPMTLQEFADKVDYEGGILAALEYGLKPEDAPEGECRERWADICFYYQQMEPYISDIMSYWEKNLEA